MIITPGQIQVIEYRRQEQLAAAARTHLITAGNQPQPSATSQRSGRIRASLRHVAATLVSVASIG